jgi:hypothetical protein
MMGSQEREAQLACGGDMAGQFGCCWSASTWWSSLGEEEKKCDPGSGGLFCKVSRYLVAAFLLYGLARDLPTFCYATAVGALIGRAGWFARWEIESGGALSVRNNSFEER